MAVLTNSEVQEILGGAETYLDEVFLATGAGDKPVLGYIRALISSIRIHSKSGNNIPGYRGQGLREAVDLAKFILATKPISDRTVGVLSYKDALLAITYGGRG